MRPPIDINDGKVVFDVEAGVHGEADKVVMVLCEKFTANIKISYQRLRMTKMRQ